MRGFEPVNAFETRTKSYPEAPTFFKGWSWLDDFNRAALNMTNAPEIYAVGTTGTGSQTMINNSSVRLGTGATSLSDADMRTVFQITRANETDLFDARSSVVITQLIRLTAITDVEVFVGLIDQTAAMTALPSTENMLGVVVDRSTSANFLFIESDGTTPVSTDTGVAVDTANKIVRITWNADGAIIELLNDSGEVLASRTVVNVPTISASRGMVLHAFVSNEAAAAKNLDYNVVRMDLS